MNSKARSRTAGATALFALLLGTAACGTATTDTTDPGTQPEAVNGIHPPTSAPDRSTGGVSADSAERRAADQARAEKADALRAAQGIQHANKLGHPGMP